MKFVKLAEELAEERDKINIELTVEQAKVLNKLKKWAEIVHKADLLVN